jgi:hypothetical protein
MLKISNWSAIILLLILNFLPAFLFVLGLIIESKGALKFLRNISVILSGLALFNFSNLTGLNNKNGYCQIATLSGYFIILFGICLFIDRKRK